MNLQSLIILNPVLRRRDVHHAATRRAAPRLPRPHRFLAVGPHARAAIEANLIQLDNRIDLGKAWVKAATQRLLDLKLIRTLRASVYLRTPSLKSRSIPKLLFFTRSLRN